MRIIDKCRITGAAVAAVLCIAGTATSASASTPPPTLHANQRDASPANCTSLGSDQYGNSGEMCIGLETYPDSNNTSTLWAKTMSEIYCINSAGAWTQCAEAQLYGTIADGQTGAGTRAEYHCGHAYGPCKPEAVNLGSRSFKASSCGSLSNNIWGVAYGQGALTGVELPVSGKWVYLGSSNANDSGNESTGHYEICP